jgi:hypothetical protein
MKITECVRKSGITYLTVSGMTTPLKVSDAGRLVDIEDVSEKTVNGQHKILAVIVPDTIRIAQPGLQDIPAGIAGGSVAFTESHFAEGPASPAVPAAGAIHNRVPAKTTWAKPSGAQKSKTAGK